MIVKPAMWWSGLERAGVPSENVLSIWPMWEGGGSGVMDVAGENDGVIDGVTWATGPVLEFGGSNDSINLGNVLPFDFDTPFSWHVRYKSSSLGFGTHVLLSKQESSGDFRGYGLQIRGDEVGDPYRAILASDTSNRIQVEFTRSNDTEWHDVVVTYDGSGVAAGVLLYEDGQLQTPSVRNDNFTSGTMTNTVDLTFGIRGTSFDFTGSMDMVGMFSGVLNPRESRQLYERPYDFITPRRREPVPNLSIAPPTGSPSPRSHLYGPLVGSLGGPI